MVTFKNSPVQLDGLFPSIGQKAPDFLLVDGSLQEKSLYQDFSGKKILMIVPSLDTEVCATSGKKFREKLKDKEATLLLVSADLPFAQKRFCTANASPKTITLSMMHDKSFGSNYGVLIKDGPLKGLCTRAVLVLDEDNSVLYAELVSEITQEPNYEKPFLFI